MAQSSIKQGCPLAIVNFYSFSGALGSVPATQRSTGQSPLSGKTQTSPATPHAAGAVITSQFILMRSYVNPMTTACQ